MSVAEADVEALITDPLEAELAGLRDLQSLDSVSAEGNSTVTCRFGDRVSTPEALRRARRPILLAYGDRDPWVPLEQAVRLRRIPARTAAPQGVVKLVKVRYWFHVRNDPT